MVDFYVKNEAGEVVKASDQQIEELFKEKSEKIVAKKLSSERERYRAKIDEELRKEVTDQIKADTRKELETEFEAKYQSQLTEAESKSKELDAKLRRKTIAAEYGFKPEAEDFLGNGTDDEMRAKADILKNSFDNKQSSPNLLDKETSEASTGCVRICSTDS